MSTASEIHGKIYVFWQEDSTFYKVGFTSKDLPQVSRGPGIQTGNPKPIHLLAYWDGTWQDELDLQKSLESFRTRDSGEWYDLSVPALLEAICFTRQKVLRPAIKTYEPLEEFVLGEVVFLCGTYQNLEGFLGEEVIVPGYDFAPDYQSSIDYHKDHVTQGTFKGAKVYIPVLRQEVVVPLKCLSLR